MKFDSVCFRSICTSGVLNWINLNSLLTSIVKLISADSEMNDDPSEPELIINHLNENHCDPEDSCSDSEPDLPSGPDLQENHHMVVDSPSVQHREEEENGQPPMAEVVLADSEEGAEMVLLEEQPSRYLSPQALKKHIHSETAKVNNELRALITKEIRKPGRRTSNSLHSHNGRCPLCAAIVTESDGS